ncbi:unnamed protein product [Cochlearia groenlandica]
MSQNSNEPKQKKWASSQNDTVQQRSSSSASDKDSSLDEDHAETMLDRTDSQIPIHNRFNLLGSCAHTG